MVEKGCGVGVVRGGSGVVAKEGVESETGGQGRVIAEAKMRSGMRLL